jgi:hypothetical protein
MRKTDLAAWVYQQIKAKLLDPREAFNNLWVKYYEEVKPGHQSEIEE